MHIIDLNSPIVSDIMGGYRVKLTLPHVSGAMLVQKKKVSNAPYLILV